MAKQLTLSVAISSLILGTSSQLFGQTLGEFSSADRTNSKIQMCEVFPGYIHVLLEDLEKDLEKFEKKLKQLPDSNLHSGADKKFKVPNKLNTLEADDLSELSEEIEGHITSIEKEKDSLSEDLDKVAGIKGDLGVIADDIYQLLVKLDHYTETANLNCVEGDYESVSNELKKLFNHTDLNQTQITHLFNYYKSIKQPNGQGKATSSAANPNITQDVLNGFYDSIDKQIKPINNQIESDIADTESEVTRLNDERDKIKALIKQKKAEEEEKAAKEEEREKQKQQEQQEKEKEQKQKDQSKQENDEPKDDDTNEVEKEQQDSKESKPETDNEDGDKSQGEDNKDDQKDMEEKESSGSEKSKAKKEDESKDKKEEVKASQSSDESSSESSTDKENDGNEKDEQEAEDES
ncbi:hypothetical protein [Thalassobacillus sp. CUG 92003]|uniref:hypothetical protein n=1 Tax=Thalassobacillus sp. CUG 92003 TaxID=2736641 RepID=UPI0015E6F10D|nr:hypothetical protein [Thalassobacillus sp. CUG 92003]